MELQQILDSVDSVSVDTPFIIAADVNAHSSSWHCHNTDHKGEAVDMWLTQNDLHILNVRTDVFTFNGPRHASNIDITVCSSSLHDSLGAWTVNTEVTTSDHAAITFELWNTNIPHFDFRPYRYNEKAADWDRFDRALEAALLKYAFALSHVDIDLRADALTKAIQQAAAESIPTSRPRQIIKPPWWTNELSSLRKALKRSVRSKYLPETRILTREYASARNAYLSALRASKRASWHQTLFVGGR